MEAGMRVGGEKLMHQTDSFLGSRISNKWLLWEGGEKLAFLKLKSFQTGPIAMLWSMQLYDKT